MLIFEFLNTYLKGRTLPLPSEYRMTLSATVIPEPELKNNIVIPEFIPNGKSLSIISNNGFLTFIGLNKKFHQNKIYSFYGVDFFIYEKGDRNPKYNGFFIRKHKIALFLIFFIQLIILIIAGFQYNITVGSYVYEDFNKIHSGYISNGIVKIYDEPNDYAILNKFENVIFSGKKYNGFLSTIKLNVVSKKENKNLVFDIIKSNGEEIVVVDTFYEENQIMKALGQYGIQFVSIDGDLYVSDPRLAYDIINDFEISKDIKIYPLEMDKLKPDIFYLDSLPYSIFYSDNSESYIYNDSSRFWVGNYVQDIGVLMQILPNKVIFKDKNIEKIYAYNN